jgi:hypothetical protein
MAHLVSPYVGPHPDGVCTGCGQRLIRVTADDTEHPWCGDNSAAGDLVDDLVMRALLTLGASRVGGEVIDGTASDAAAIELGRAWGRTKGTGVLRGAGSKTTYAWPERWAEAVADRAGLTGDDMHIEWREEPST